MGTVVGPEPPRRAGAPPGDKALRQGAISSQSHPYLLHMEALWSLPPILERASKAL